MGEYFEKLKNEAIAEEKAKQEEEARLASEKAVEEAKQEATALASTITADEEFASNKRRAETTEAEKEPEKKKTKENKRKKKVLAAGGISMFGGKDLFGGKNPFAARKQESSSEESEEEELPEDPEPAKPVQSIHVPAPPPPPMFSRNLTVTPNAEEKPVSFDDMPTNSHLISSSNKNRVTLPNRRRLPGSRANKSNITNGLSNGDLEKDALDVEKEIEAEPIVSHVEINERLAPTIKDTDYDGDESEMSHSHIKRGRRSIKKRTLTKSGILVVGEKEIATNHSIQCDQSMVIKEEKIGEKIDEIDTGQNEEEKRKQEQQDRERKKKEDEDMKKKEKLAFIMKQKLMDEEKRKAQLKRAEEQRIFEEKAVEEKKKRTLDQKN